MDEEDATWRKMVDRSTVGSTGKQLRVKELLQKRVQIAVAVQQPGDLIIGGPLVNHAVSASRTR